MRWRCNEKGALFIDAVLPVSLLLLTPTAYPHIHNCLKCIIRQPFEVNWKLLPCHAEAENHRHCVIKMCTELSWGNRTKEDILSMKVAVDGCS